MSAQNQIKEAKAITDNDVESKVTEQRGNTVILDRYVTDLHPVKTKRINEAVKNNPDKFLITLIQDDWKRQVSTAFTEKGLYDHHIKKPSRYPKTIFEINYAS